jgi:2'-deoxynucleoside 5'-phosphate N-hydrolase
MKIYFSCSITGGRQDQPAYQALVEHLLDEGHRVLTAVLANPDILSEEVVVEPVEVFERDVSWVKECDALVAEVSTPSHGVGYEIALALCLGKPVICCYLQGKSVSKMITGNSSPGMLVFEYRHVQEACQRVDEFLNQVG